ncbi:hypothetical protein I79_017296 [Cricetulus griseus]|uniref:Uncharacterized protein n=1 Tax=Cricetulus griseus TaxID=10029 RepID=G3I1N3_CRIGR|nr:hypothetical protein I79_017296 [Cricetulus griseus]
MSLSSSELWSVLAPSSLNLFSAKSSGYVFSLHCLRDLWLLHILDRFLQEARP